MGVQLLKKYTGQQYENVGGNAHKQMLNVRSAEDEWIRDSGAMVEESVVHIEYEQLLATARLADDKRLVLRQR